MENDNASHDGQAKSNERILLWACVESCSYGQ